MFAFHIVSLLLRECIEILSSKDFNSVQLSHAEMLLSFLGKRIRIPHFLKNTVN